MSRGFVQVAGVHNVEEMLLLARCGVEAAGFPLRLPVHAEDCDEAAAAAIIRDERVRNTGIVTTCITYETDPDEAAILTRRIGATMLQLHADVTVESLARLRSLAPDIVVIKSLIVGRGSVDELIAKAQAAAPHVDAFITDTLDPESGATGATGRVHDWNASRRIARAVARPLILAGGLGPQNVAEAIRCVGAAAVDAHTGLEGSNGRKDEERVSAFVQRSRQAYAKLDHTAEGTIPWPEG